MFASINRVGFASDKHPSAVRTDVVIFLLEAGSDLFIEQINYLRDIQTLVLVQKELVRYATKPDYDFNYMSGTFRVFVTNRDQAMLFKLKLPAKVRADTQMWLVPEDDKMRALLLNK